MFYSICMKALGIYAVQAVISPSTTTATRCCPWYLATLPVTPANAPSMTRTSCPEANLGISTSDMMVLSFSAAQIIFRLSI